MHVIDVVIIDIKCFYIIARIANKQCEVNLLAKFYINKILANNLFNYILTIKLFFNKLLKFNVKNNYLITIIIN